MNRQLARFLAKLRSLFAARKGDGEFDREIGVHLEFLEDEYLRQGIAPSEARRRARIARTYKVEGMAGKLIDQNNAAAIV